MGPKGKHAETAGGIPANSDEDELLPPPYRPPSPAPTYRTVDSRVMEGPVRPQPGFTARIRNLLSSTPSRRPPPPPRLVPRPSVQTAAPTVATPARAQLKPSGGARPAERQSSETILAKARSAIETNDQELFDALIAETLYDVNAPLDDDGSRLLHVAADLDRLSMVEALLKSDVDVSILAQDGYTALHRAVRKDHSAIIEMLLAAEAKAKTKSCPRHSRSSFELAAQCGFEDIVRALFSKFQTMQGPPYLLDSGILHLWVNFAYLYAAEHGHRAITVFLHNALNDIHIEALTRYNGMQTLAHAIRQSWPDVVDQLISKHRRDNNTLANKVSSASSGSGSCTTLEDLVTAAKLGNTQVMEQLLRAGVLDNEPSAQRGATTLWPPHSATVQGHLDAMRLLLDWGADPNAQDSFGETPLHLAMWDRRPSMPEIRVLIQRGADVHLLNGRGRSPCFRARDMNAGDLDYLFVESEWHWR